MRVRYELRPCTKTTVRYALDKISCEEGGGDRGSFGNCVVKNKSQGKGLGGASSQGGPAGRGRKVESNKTIVALTGRKEDSIVKRAEPTS